MKELITAVLFLFFRLHTISGQTFTLTKKIKFSRFGGNTDVVGKNAAKNKTSWRVRKA